MQTDNIVLNDRGHGQESVVSSSSLSVPLSAASLMF